MAATIKDIKDMTGLSLATISKYLNGGNLLPENREKIEKAIKELHYEVNELARGLVTSKSRVIGIVVFDIANVFTCTLLKYLGACIREAGYAAMICDSQNDEKLEIKNIRFLMNKKVDGLLVMPVAKSSHFLEPALKAHIPTVLLDRFIKGTGYDCVKVDNFTAAYQAIDMLASYGHRRIAIIGSDTVLTGKERLKGCLRSLKDKKIDLPSRCLKKGTHSIEHGYNSMRELLSMELPPTAVFMGNFEIILGAVMAVNESPLQCPEDISLIGFDDLIISNLSNPKLTLVVQPLQEMAENAVDILLRRLEEHNGSRDKELSLKHTDELVVLPASIVKGDSIARCSDSRPETDIVFIQEKRKGMA